MDIKIEQHGTVATLQPLTGAARQWVEANVITEPWQWLGGRLCIDPAYANDIAAGAVNDGLRVGS